MGDEILGNQTAFTGVLLDMIRGGGLRVYQATDLREQVLNATMVETARGVRLAKEKASRKIDGAVALAMAVWECTKEHRHRGEPGLADPDSMKGAWLPKRQRAELLTLYGEDVPDHAIDRDLV